MATLKALKHFNFTRGLLKMDQDTYIDMAASIVAIRNLLIQKGLATHDEFVGSFQERLLIVRAANPDAQLPLMELISRGGLKPQTD